MKALVASFGELFAGQSAGHSAGHGLALALGWTLLHFCWQGAAVAALLACVLGIVGPRRSQLRYAAACCAMALMVALPIVTFARLAGEEMARQRVASHAVLTFDITAIPEAAGNMPHGVLRARVEKALKQAVPWLPAVWIAGVGLFLGRLVLGLLIAGGLRSNTSELVEAELHAVFDGLVRRLKVRRAVALLHSAAVQVPTVVGWLRPVVLLPVSCFLGLSPEQIEALLAHELAHIRRHDYLVSVAQSVVEALLFYHPVVWWVSRQVRRERECCCDAVAAAVCGDALEYAKALSRLEERRSAGPEIVMAANGGVLTMRIKRLLGYKESPAVSPLVVAALSAALIASAGVYFAGTAHAQAHLALREGLVALVETPTSSSSEIERMLAVRVPMVVASAAGDPIPAQAGVASGESVAQAETGTAYGMWVNQDVLWIISPEERTAFLKLASDAERDEFIRSFWQQRERIEGRSGTKEENYARIAYANAHFGGSGLGWMSDRGHVYIVLGKPESIDSHPSGGTSGDSVSQFPFEVWHYSHVEGMGDNIGLRFVDACQCGDYRLQLGTGGSFSPGFSGTPTRALRMTTNAVRVSGGVMEEAAITQINPIYPAIARAAHVQGVVVFHAIIGKTGEIQELQLVSGPPMLVNSARNAVIQWKYKPYLLNGQPTEVETTINVNYSFGESSLKTPPDGTFTPVSTLEGAPVPDAAAGRQVASTETFARRTNVTADGVTMPVLISMVEPEFTVEARKAKFMGVVTVNLIVDQRGEPQKVHVVRGIGLGLDQKAVEAVRQYKFKPAMKDGKPVEASMNIEVNFQIF
jgi:TonB family protein